LQDWARAAEVREAFRRNHPNHELAPDVTRKLAVAYLESGRGRESAAEFERIAARAEEPKDVRRAALWQAAELYEKAGDAPQALKAYAAYVEAYPQPLDAAMDARQKLADAAGAAHDSGTRLQWLQKIIAADQMAGESRTDRSRYLAANATLATAEPLVAAFNGVKLVAPLEKSLQAKRAAMQKVLAVYGKALDFGVAEVTTAATYGMAETYGQLAADLMASERPKKLDADALEQYGVLLEEQAFPFEEKAIELHETNTKRAADGIYDAGVQHSFQKLAKLKPARYAKTEVADASLPSGEAELKAVVEREPANAPAYTQLGLSYRQLGRFKEAQAAYEQAIAAAPEYAPAHLNLGVLHDLYLQQPDPALQEYERYRALAGEPLPQVQQWIAEVKTRATKAPPAPEPEPGPEPGPESGPAAALKPASEPANADAAAAASAAEPSPDSSNPAAVAPASGAQAEAPAASQNTERSP